MRERMARSCAGISKEASGESAQTLQLAEAAFDASACPIELPPTLYDAEHRSRYSNNFEGRTLEHFLNTYRLFNSSDR